jgi:hypothetical protein
MRRLTSIDPVTVQAVYYVVSGLWPIIHLRSFMAVTGPKQDTWLVKTFGAFIVGIGAVLLSARGAGERRLASRLAVTSAVTLAAAEAWYVGRRRISPMYLADAVLELLFAGTILARLGRRPG